MAKRPAAPERSDFVLLSVRLSAELLQRVDLHTEVLRKQRPGEAVTRSNAIRDLLATHAPQVRPKKAPRTVLVNAKGERVTPKKATKPKSGRTAATRSKLTRR